MKKIIVLNLALFIAASCSAQKLKELAGTYIVSLKYRDTILYYSHADTMVLRNQFLKDFAKFTSNPKALIEVESLYNRVNRNYRKTKLMLNTDSTFKFLSPDDTIKGTFKMLTVEKKLQFTSKSRMSPAFDRNSLNVIYKKEGKKIKLSTISKNPLIYTKE